MKNIVVMGAGTMGSGIAQTVAEAGFNVKLFDMKEELVQRGIGLISITLTGRWKKGRFPPKNEPKP